MVWKSTRRQQGRGSFIEASSSLSLPMLSPAEIKVREIASKIGLLGDSEILTTVCHKMRKEFVLEEWQLPALDSRQWEKMQAPIGLAVAVKHVSTRRFGEPEMQIQVRKRYLDNDKHINDGQEQNEKSFVTEEIEEDTLVSTSLHVDEAKATNWSAGSSDEVIKTESNNDKNHSVVEIEAHSVSFDVSTITTDEKFGDELNETRKNVTKYEDEKMKQGNQPPLESYDLASKILKKHKGFSRDCADWLKFTKVNTGKDEGEEVLREDECKRFGEAPGALPEINNDNEADCIEENDSMITSESLSKIVGAVQSSIELTEGKEKTNPDSIVSNISALQAEIETIDTLETKHLRVTGGLEKQQDKVQFAVETNNRIDREISSTIEKNIETAQVKAAIVNDVKQESSTVHVQSDQKPSQVDVEYTEKTVNEIVTKLKDIEEKEISIVENDNGDGGEIVNTSMHSEKEPEEDFDTVLRQGIPASSSSDSEVDENSNIFSGIGISASFSDDEDDQILVGKETKEFECSLSPLESADENIISRLNSSETNLLLFTNNDADDVTVAISNVSPECKKSASERKKNRRQYNHEYDRDKASFDLETSALQDILVKFPDEDHTAILSQLMIMTNARDKVSRTNIAFQIQDSLLALIENNKLNVEPTKAVQLIFHLSRLEKSYRIIFAKSLFKAMSKLYKRTEKLKNKKRPNKKVERKNSKSKKTVVRDKQETNQKETIEDIENREESIILPK